MITYEELVNFWEEKEPDCIEWFKQLCSIQREVVPFVGAGISKNINGSAYPLWREFLEEIGKRELLSEEVEKLDQFININCYEQAASFLQERLGDVLFRDNVKKIFGEERLKDVVFPETVRLITDVFHGNIFTTNIDRVIETAFEELKHIKIPMLIPQMQSEQANQNIDANALCLIKIHGDVSESTSWVLTEEQYNLVYGENIENTSFVSILERLMISRKLLFIGCGLERDRTYDVLNRIVQKNNTYKHFAFTECPKKRDDQIIKKRQLINLWNIYPIWFPENQYESIGVLLRQMILHQGLHTFDLELKKITKLCKETIYFIDRAFLKKYSQPDEKLLRIFLLVSDELNVIAHAVCCGETFCNQDAFDVAKAYIEKDSTMPLFITGAGGQGKTVLMMELAKYFCEKDYPIFWISIGGSSLSEESIQEFMELLDEVSAMYAKKILLMLDNPYADLDYVERIYQVVNYESHPIQIIITERANRLDYLFSDDTYRFAMWSAEGKFLCLGKPCEFETFNWMKQSSVVPFRLRWRYEIVKNIFRKLEANQRVETSIVEHILKEQEKWVNNSFMSLVEIIYQFIFQYNERVENLEGIRILGKRLPLDWDEWKNWLSIRGIDDRASYAYMAALYLLKISVSVETLSRILSIPKYQLEFELDNSLGNGYREPVIYDSVNETVSIKHDMIAELYFKFHSNVSVQNILKNLLDLMNEEELLKFTKKLFNKKVVVGKTKFVFDVNIDEMLLVYLKNQDILKLLKINGELPWFELVRVWNKQINPESKDQPYSFDELSEKYKEDKKVLLETAMYYERMGNKPEEVEKLLIIILETDSVNLPALNELARFYAARGRDEEAEKTFLRALEVDSSHLPALNELAQFYASRGRDEEAEETLIYALEVENSNLPILNELGRLYKKEKKNEKALQIFEKIVSLSGDDIIALYETARLNKQMKHIDVAIQYYNKILEKSANDSKAIVGLFYCYYDDSDFQKAGEILKNNSGLQNEEYYLRCCARLCKKLKRTEDIKQIKERLMKIGSNYVI